MSGFEEVHVTAALAAELERQGWVATEARAREVAAAASRGTNLILEAPPEAWHALPLLAGMLSTAATPRRFLLLAPAPALDEWAESAASLAAASGIPLIVAAGPGRAARRIRETESWLLLTTPATALALTQRLSLKCAELTGLMLAWPEAMKAESEMEALMVDLPKDAPRGIVTSDPGLMAGLGERYARRALQVALPHPAPAPAEAATTIGAIGKVHIAVVPRRQRAEAVTAVLDVLDPANPAIWAPGRSTMALEVAGRAGIPLITGEAAPEGTRPLVVALELPTPVRLAALTASADVVLLVPAHALSWARRVAPAATVLRLPGAIEAAMDEAAERRATIAARMEGGVGSEALLALAPLFERHEPAAVAAALYGLWLEPGKPAVQPTSQPASTAPTTGTARIWVSLGKKDGGTANDLVGCLTRECRVDRTQIGRIELRETFSLIEVPAADAEKIADRLTGISIRQRRVMARVDKGVATPDARPRRDGPRSPRRGSPRS